MKFIFLHSKHVGMEDKNYEILGQRSLNLHNNDRHVGFLGVSVTAIILQRDWCFYPVVHREP